MRLLRNRLGMELLSNYVCCTLSSLQREIKRLLRCSSLNPTRNISSTTRSFSSILYRGCKQHSTDTALITDTRNMVIGTASNVSFENLNDELTSSQTVSATLKQKLWRVAKIVRLRMEPDYLNTISRENRRIFQ